MRVLSDEQVVAALTWDGVLSALEDAFRDPARFQTPERVAISQGGDTFLTMPCADRGGWFGVKQVAVKPDNAARGKPSVQAWYTLQDPEGEPALAMGATLLTRMRTAGVSAVAAKYLARADVATLLVVGTGALAPWMADAHLQVRRYEQVLVWGRNSDKARATARDISQRAGSAAVKPVSDLADALLEADVITSATTAREPILHGTWLRSGQHLDIVGAFVPQMSEVDADAVRRARVFVDDVAACQAEAGDLIQAAQRSWSWEAVAGDLNAVVTGRAGRQGSDDLTLFKSVGLAFEDLVVARRIAESGAVSTPEAGPT